MDGGFDIKSFTAIRKLRIVTEKINRLRMNYKG